MLSSISPVGETSRKQRWAVTVTAYLIGCIAAGALVGTALGALGQFLLAGLSPTIRLASIGVIALAGVALDLTSGVPTLHRQVDERWLTEFRGWVYGLGFGAQLGTGVVTIMPSSIVLAMWLGTLVAAHTTTGIVVGLVFGTARGLPLLAAGRVRTVSALRRTLRWMDTVRPAVRRSIPVAQGVVGGAVVASIVIGPGL